jgi:hypothetical protein
VEQAVVEPVGVVLGDHHQLLELEPDPGGAGARYRRRAVRLVPETDDPVAKGTIGIMLMAVLPAALRQQQVELAIEVQHGLTGPDPLQQEGADPGQPAVEVLVSKEVLRAKVRTSTRRWSGRSPLVRVRR